MTVTRRPADRSYDPRKLRTTEQLAAVDRCV